MVKTHTRTLQQTACDGVRRAWRAPTPRVHTDTHSTSSIDGIARTDDRVVLHAYARREVISTESSSQNVVVLPLIKRVAHSMAGVRVPRPRNQIQLNPFPAQK